MWVFFFFLYLQGDGGGRAAAERAMCLVRSGTVCAQVYVQQSHESYTLGFAASGDALKKVTLACGGKTNQMVFLTDEL